MADGRETPWGAEAVDVADEIVLLLDGRVSGHGPASMFYRDPPSLAAARFFGVINELTGHVRHGVWLYPCRRAGAT